MPDIDLNALVQSLYARRHEAVTVPFEERSIASGPPLETECHNNTDRWVLEHSGHKSVRGWMVFDFNKMSEGLYPVCRFTAHSVVEDSTGRLFDPTPSRASQRYPFLRHEGPEAEFVAVVKAGYVNLDHVVMD
jgi:hypothetical protein